MKEGLQTCEALTLCRRIGRAAAIWTWRGRQLRTRHHRKPSLVLRNDPRSIPTSSPWNTAASWGAAWLRGLPLVQAPNRLIRIQAQQQQQQQQGLPRSAAASGSR